MKTKKKSITQFIFLTGLVCLIAVSLTACCKKPPLQPPQPPQPTVPEEISGETDYYTLEVPDNWRVLINEDPGAPFLGNLIMDSNDYTTHDAEDGSSVIIDAGASMSVSVEEGDIVLPFEEEFMELDTSIQILESDDITISGEQGRVIKYTDKFYQDAIVYEAYIIYQGNAYGFKYRYNPDAYPQGEDEFFEILDGFVLK